MRDTGPNLATRQLVIDRAQRRCERCRDWGSQIHHRKPRGMGGTRNPQINAPSNLVFLCFDCHEWIERNRDAARMSGWLVPRNDDPELIEPVQESDFLQAGHQAVLVVLGATGHREQQGGLVDHQQGGVLMDDFDIRQRHGRSTNDNGGLGRRCVRATDQRSWSVMLSSRMEQLPWFSSAT